MMTMTLSTRRSLPQRPKKKHALYIYLDSLERNVIWNGNRWLWKLEDGRVFDYGDSTWTTPDNVQVKFLADNYDGEAGTVLASFNAG